MFNFGLIVIIFLFSVISIEATLIERLKKFDTFHHDSMHHHVNKRDLYTQYPNDRGLEFDSLGRHFKISLRKEKDLFSPNFRVVVVENEVERAIEFHPNLYHGILEGDKKSYVNAYLDDDGTLTGTVETESGKYVFEPSWRHLPDQKNITMIAYEEDDVDFERDLGKNFCGYIKVKTDEEKLKESEEIDVEENESEETGSESETESETETDVKKDNLNEPKYRRSKRASSCTKDDKMICTVLLVADYRFFRNMGNNNYQRTAGYLISQIDQINQIYSKQMFGSCGNGFEFEIREIRIHNDPSPAGDKKYPYNVETDNWDTTDLLETFSRDQNFESFCLAHLFTYTAFSNGVLGLAYIGSSRQHSVGGICSSSYNKNGRPLYLNTGWSSSLNRYNRKLLTTEACLVTAHEFGHNWGSEHDPDTDECSPSANTGGKYIMFTYSVSGREDNNKVFSPCSRRSIGAVLRSKAQTCFSRRTGAFCGNYKIDEGEQCDEGPDEGPDAANQNLVKCCSKCKLTPSSVCSDTNHQCCDKCHYASRDKNCTGEQDFGCKAASKCSGVDTKCGAATIKPNGTSCLDTGKCVNGKCLSICEFNNKVPCICDTVERSCRWCCKDNSPNATCQPFSSHNGEMNLPVGTPCLQGLCDEKGECIKQVYNSIQRLWSIIENMDVNQLVMFMRANIVGTVIILSLVIWIPASCIIAVVDKRNAKKEMDEVDWFNPKNPNVLGSKESETVNIRKSNVRPHQSKNLKLYIPPRN